MSHELGVEEQWAHADRYILATLESEIDFDRFASSASARLYLKQAHCFGKQEVGHAGEVLSE